MWPRNILRERLEEEDERPLYDVPHDGSEAADRADRDQVEQVAEVPTWQVPR